MSHKIPLYYAKVNVGINKKTAVIRETQEIELTMIVKGFHFDDIVNRCQKSIEREVGKKIKLAANEFIKVKNIRYLMQLGYGI